MQEPNWGVFSAKFNGKERETFQWFCYLLFCQEYNLPLGVNRYANHAGIETDPIKVGDDYIGWQAKYYDTPLSDHTQKLISTITSTKKNHPDVTKIIFYLNRDFGQTKDGKDPKGKVDVESHAKKNGVDIIWRNSSYFETSFVAKDNAAIARHFFRLDKSIFDLTNELRGHTESILDLIQDRIIYEKKNIRLDRTGILGKVAKAASGDLPVILSGEGGVGKTAVIKEFYERVKNDAPLFVFKSSEFNRTNVNELTRQYGDFTALDFVAAYPETKNKYIVFDSAEKLADIEDPTVFEEFLSLLIRNAWTVIFTTRRSYLHDLKNILLTIYNTSFQSIDIPLLTSEELNKVSSNYKFVLPTSKRMLEILRNPFYLNEYLQNYTSIEKNITQPTFKKVLWEKQISKSLVKTNNMHIRRSECFLGLARKRAEEGYFFIKSDGFDQEALSALMKDEIIGYDEDVLGYFIAHDIYEEWALDKVIDSSYTKFSDPSEFFSSIGESLPMRRAFRSWLSNKLLVDGKTVTSLIEKTLGSDAKQFWQDEVLISVLLSETPSKFLGHFENELLKNDAFLLVRMTFLLRIACKEINENFIRVLRLTSKEKMDIETLYTLPKGSGWSYIIDFLQKNIATLGSKHIKSILPLLHDWTSNNKQGETTKKAGLIGIFYYEYYSDRGGFGYGSNDISKDIIDVILDSSGELKTELSAIIDEVVSGKQPHHQDRYFKLAESMLSDVTQTLYVAHAIPDKIIALANCFWIASAQDEDHTGLDEVEQDFGLRSHTQDYFPSSAFQTPIFGLLQAKTKATIDFILFLTNITTGKYSTSPMGESEVITVDVHFEGETRKQYASTRLWEAFRGTHVSTTLLESIFMALEKWMLSYGQRASKENFDALCLYLLKGTNSASISAVVASVTAAHPEKAFGAASVLFKTREFFNFDSIRLQKEDAVKRNNEITSLNATSKFFNNERLKTIDDKHRQLSLENLIFDYQVTKYKGDKAADIKHRQETIWTIIDNHIKELPEPSSQTDEDKKWRLILTNIDSRKMTPQEGVYNGEKVTMLVSDVEPELESFREEKLKKVSEITKYLPLEAWAVARWRFDVIPHGSEKYENNIQVVIEDVKDVLKRLSSDQYAEARQFDFLTPVYACSVLIRDYIHVISKDDKHWCKGILFQYINEIVLNPQHSSYHGDGQDALINVLPLLKDNDNSDEINEVIKMTLFSVLFNHSSITVSNSVADYGIYTILNRLWDISPDDANSLLIGYILLRPQYIKLREEKRLEKIKAGEKPLSWVEVFELLGEENEKDFQDITDNKVNFSQLPALETIDLHILETAFKMLPWHIKDDRHRAFLNEILPLFAERLPDHRERGEYSLGRSFFEKYARFLLKQDKDTIKEFLTPFKDNMTSSQNTADMLGEFISVEIEAQSYDAFWSVWDLLYDKIIQICKDKPDAHDTKSIIHNYLLAWPYWKREVRSWSSLKQREKRFFAKVIQDIGFHPEVLYSIAKNLNRIAYDFLDDGILWISKILKEHHSIFTKNVNENTVFFIEGLTRRFVILNRRKLKKDKVLRQEVLIVLDFLINEGSVTAYLTREDLI